MRSRHAAALSLLGWLLLLPPVSPTTQQVDKDAPLSHWKLERTYSGKKACEGRMDHLRRQGLAATKKQGNAFKPDLSCPICNAQCVYDDDPRLEEK